MLKEGYIAKWKEYPKDEIKIRVARPSILGPSSKLLADFMERKKFWESKGLSELEARKKAGIDVDYENRFRKEILSNPKAVEKLREIKRLAETKDVRLICYEKKPPCHRFILMELIEDRL